MIDILELQAELDAALEREADALNRIKGLEKAFFEKVVEVDLLNEKLESLEVTV